MVVCYRSFSSSPRSAQAFLLDQGDLTAVSTVKSMPTLLRKLDLDYVHIL